MEGQNSIIEGYYAIIRFSAKLKRLIIVFMS